MKALIIGLLFFGITICSYSQSKESSTTHEGKVDIEELPAVVIKSAGKDFSVYLPDRNPDKSVRNIQDKFIAYDLGKDYEGYERYLVTMQVDKGTLAATYNENGKLIRVVENYKNVKLPNAVIYSVYKAFPGWRFVNDKFLYTQADGDIIKKEYNIKIKRDNETRKLVVNPNGEILAGLD